MTNKDKAKKTANYKTSMEINFPTGVTKPKKGGRKTTPFKSMVSFI